MKKSLFVLAMFIIIATFSLSAQLQVDSLGRTFVGYETLPMDHNRP